MKHYGHEPPWRGYSFHYGEWKKIAELWDGDGFTWEWVPPDKPGSLLAALSRELDFLRGEMREILDAPAMLNLAQLHGRVQVT